MTLQVQNKNVYFTKNNRANQGVTNDSSSKYNVILDKKVLNDTKDFLEKNPKGYTLKSRGTTVASIHKEDVMSASFIKIVLYKTDKVAMNKERATISINPKNGVTTFDGIDPSDKENIGLSVKDLITKMKTKMTKDQNKIEKPKFDELA